MFPMKKDPMSIMGGASAPMGGSPMDAMMSGGAGALPDMPPALPPKKKPAKKPAAKKPAPAKKKPVTKKKPAPAKKKK